MVVEKWEASHQRRPEGCYSITYWQGSLGFMRQHLKGWNIQQIGEQKIVRANLLQQLEGIDRLCESRELLAEEWQKRYEIENELENIYQMEAIYWQQHGSDLGRGCQYPILSSAC
jgi:hypothetical protein